jgi:chromosome partitioning protein
MIIRNTEEIANRLNISKVSFNKIVNSENCLPLFIKGGVRKNYYTTDGLLELVTYLVEKNIDNKSGINIYNQYKSISQLDISKKTKSIVFNNMKGGVAKTTTVVNVGSLLSILGYKVLIVDMDAQAHSSNYFTDQEFKSKSIMSIFEKFRFSPESIDEAYINQFIYKTKIQCNNKEYNIDILPSEIRLSRALEVFRSERNSYSYLKNILSHIKDNYDFILIDTSPNPGIPLEMSLYASDYLAILTDAEKNSVSSFQYTLEEITNYKNDIEHKIDIIGLFITKYQKQKTVHQINYDKILNIALDNGISSKKIYNVVNSTLFPYANELEIPVISVEDKNYKELLTILESSVNFCINLIKENQ